MVDPARTEADIVQRLVAGDAAAWSHFVDSYQRLVLARVFATARELNQLLNQADAEDLCADVFGLLVARDFAALREFAGRSSLSTWLTVITRRHCLRQLAAARRNPARPSGDATEAMECVRDRQSDPLMSLVHHENRRRLDALLAELPERQRELVRLAYVEQCSYREISERLGIPANSIGPTLQRLQHKLREQLQP